MTAFRYLAATLSVGLALSSCTTIFDYGDEPLGAGGATAGTGAVTGTGGATVGTGGAGGATPSCVNAGDCDDLEDCTTDACSAEGVCEHTPLADGAECQNGSGQDGVCGGGTCIVSCTAGDPTVCDDANECTVDSCDTDIGQCVNDPVPDGSVASQTEGDCKDVSCIAGVLTEVNDDADAFNDSNGCTDDLCNAGVPENPILPEGTSCGADLVCDATGTCVGCNAPSDCPGANSFCQTVTCTNSVCGVDYTAAGTPLPAQDQIANDCKEKQCDGTGGEQTANEAAGTACDDGLYCTTSDSCLSGNCSQNAGDPCPGADGDSDCSESCNESNDSCTANDPGGSSCDDGTFCNGADTCQSGSCQHAGDPCPGADGDSDCSETCNETANACSGADPNGSSCDDGAYCNGGDTCQSGSCSHSGNPCPGADGDNDCSESCSESANNCSGYDPNSASCDDGTYCNGSDTCNGSGSCNQHTGDPCPGADGDSDCSETCSESANACSGNDPNGVSCDDGAYCNGSDSCQSGSCSHTGDPCTGPDGDGDCSESCSESANNCTGNDPNGAICTDGAYCNGSDTCNGSGSCATHAGDPCLPVFGGSCFSSCSESANNCSAQDPYGIPCASGCCNAIGNCNICP